MLLSSRLPNHSSFPNPKILVLHHEDLSHLMQSHLCRDPAAGSSSSHGQWHKKCPLIFLKSCTGVSTNAACKTVFYWLSQFLSALLPWQGLYPDPCKYKCLFWWCTNRCTCDQTPRSLGPVTQDTRDKDKRAILKAVFYFMEDLKKEVGSWPCVDCHGPWNSLGTDVLWAQLSCYILQSHKTLNPGRQMAYNKFLTGKNLKPVGGDQMKMRETLPKSL